MDWLFKPALANHADHPHRQWCQVSTQYPPPHQNICRLGHSAPRIKWPTTLFIWTTSTFDVADHLASEPTGPPDKCQASSDIPCLCPAATEIAAYQEELRLDNIKRSLFMDKSALLYAVTYSLMDYSFEGPYCPRPKMFCSSPFHTQHKVQSTWSPSCNCHTESHATSPLYSNSSDSVNMGHFLVYLAPLCGASKNRCSTVINVVALFLHNVNLSFFGPENDRPNHTAGKVTPGNWWKEIHDTLDIHDVLMNCQVT